MLIRTSLALELTLKPAGKIHPLKIIPERVKDYQSDCPIPSSSFNFIEF